MKKLIITAFLVLVFGLTACTATGDSTEGNSTQSDNRNQGEQTERDEFVIDVPANCSGEVLCDNDNYIIKVEKIEVDEDYKVTLSFTNKSSEHIKFTVNEPAINGLMYDEPAEFVSVKAGETQTHELSIRGSWLEKYDFGQIWEIFYTIEAKNGSNDKLIRTELCASYPYGEAEVEYFKYEPTDADVLVVDTEGYRVYASLDVKSSSVEIQMYAENHTEQTVRVGGEYPTVNNRMLDITSEVGTYVAPGKCAITDMTIWDDDLSKVDIYDVEEIVKLSFFWKITNHKEGLYTYGGNTTEDVYNQSSDLYVSGKENAAVPEINGKLLWDNYCCTVYYIKTTNGEEPTVTVAFLNKISRPVHVYMAENLIENAVGGYGTDGMVLSHAVRYMDLTWFLEDLQEAEIDIGSADGFKFSFEFEVNYEGTDEIFYEKIIRTETSKKE